MSNMPRLIFLTLITMSLAACALDSPAPQFGTHHIGKTLTNSIQVDGNTFKVYRHPALDTAEAHRVNFLYPPPSRPLIIEQGRKAMEQMTGCTVRKGSLNGDQAIVKAELNCSNA